jgi:hypothetical protein
VPLRDRRRPNPHKRDVNHISLFVSAPSQSASKNRHSPAMADVAVLQRSGGERGTCRISRCRCPKIKAAILAGPPYSPLKRWSVFGMLPVMASLTPLRYPIPYPTTQAATAQPAIKSHVSPLGIVHTMCMVAKRGARSPIPVAATPMPVSPAVAPPAAVPTPPASLAHQLDGRGGVEFGPGRLGRSEGSRLN